MNKNKFNETDLFFIATIIMFCVLLFIVSSLVGGGLVNLLGFFGSYLTSKYFNFFFTFGIILIGSFFLSLVFNDLVFVKSGISAIMIYYIVDKLYFSISQTDLSLLANL